MSITENELIVPSLYLIASMNEGMDTSALKDSLRSMIELDEHDSMILKGRNDDHFSQKVRNLVSHKTLERLGYAVRNGGKFIITQEGLDYINEKENIKILADRYNLDFEGSETVESISVLSEDDYISSSRTEGIYPQAALNIERTNFSVFELKRKHEKKQLILDPDFQRNQVWKNRQKAELVESIIMNIPLPFIYLNENKLGQLIVIDGRQRLTALFEFLDNGFNMGKSLKIMRNLDNKYFKDLEPVLQGTIEDFQIITNIIKPPTSDRVMIDIFDRVNRSGTMLNNQEIRNALYQGNSTRLIKKLSKNDRFLEATSNSIRTDRMKDRYIILRALAFYIWKSNPDDISSGAIPDYKGDTEEFLAKYMEHINQMDADQLQQLEDTFTKAVSSAYETLGDDVFRLPSRKNSNLRRPINMALFEALVYLFSDVDIESNKTLLIEQYQNLLQNEEFLNSFLSIDSNAKYRFQEMERIKNTIKHARQS